MVRLLLVALLSLGGLGFYGLQRYAILQTQAQPVAVLPPFPTTQPTITPTPQPTSAPEIPQQTIIKCDVMGKTMYFTPKECVYWQNYWNNKYQEMMADANSTNTVPSNFNLQPFDLKRSMVESIADYETLPPETLPTIDESQYKGVPLPTKQPMCLNETAGKYEPCN